MGGIIIMNRGAVCVWTAITALFLMLLASVGPANAERLPAEVFAKLPRYQQARLSPGIQYLAYIFPINGRKHVVIQSAAGGGDPTLVPPVQDADIMWFRWANNERLLIAYEATRFERGLAVPFTRLMAINADGSDAINVVREERALNVVFSGQIETRIVDLLPGEPNHILLALDTDRNGNYSVQKVNIDSARQSRAERAISGAQNWLADQQGVPRLSWGVDGSDFAMSYKNPDGGWEKVTKTQWYQSGFRPVGFDVDPRFVFAVGPVNGRAGIVKLDLTTGLTAETIFSHPTVDVGSIVYDVTGRKVVGVRYTDHFEETKYFDPSYQRIQAGIEQASPGATNRIVDPHPARGMYLVHVASTQSKTGYYIFESRSRRFYLVAPTGQDIRDRATALKQPVSYRARDGQLIHGYLTVPVGREPQSLPTVVLPHGGPQVRDDQHYDYWSQFVANRGYAVFQPNFRGSTGYGYAFEKAGEKQWGGVMQDDVTDGTQWLISEGIADPARICIVGWSYGGYAALMGAVKTPDLFKCAASVNGVTNIPSMVVHDEKFIGGTIWTRDMALEGERRRSISPYHQRDRIRIPILLVADKRDSRVPYQQSKSMYRALNSAGIDVTYIETDGGGHSLDHQEARLAMLNGLEAFLHRHIGR